MKKHTKIYFDYFDIWHNESGEHDFIKCEVCDTEAVDIHHIVARGMGGSKLKDSIANLMALCRTCHEKFGDKTGYRDFLISKHRERIKIFEKLNNCKL